MYQIISKEKLNSTVSRMQIHAPFVARKAEAGQFVILRVDDSERIPLTIADYDRARGLITIIYQVVGATTKLLDQKEAGDFLTDFVGPLGLATKTEHIRKAAVIGGGVGSAIALPVAKKLHGQGAEVTSVIGFRSKELVILESEFSACSDRLIITTDDGSYGERANVTLPLKSMLENGETFDEVICIGPLVMMKYVVEAVRPYGIPCTVSMNPIMIDGTGMCGGCRLSLNTDGKKTVRFACVDGPDFNGYEVDFDEAISRSKMYQKSERHAYEAACNLLKR